MDRQKPTEEEVRSVNEWISNFSETGKVAEMDPMLLRSVLTEFGANFDISAEAKESLSKFSNVERRKGMDAVWGNDEVKSYRIWLRHWVEDYERKTEKPLPVLEGTDSKTSGGLKFFTDLTVFSAGLMTFEKYKEVTERRYEKGKVWQERNETEPYTPTEYSSFPPELPNEAWEFIKHIKD